MSRGFFLYYICIQFQYRMTKLTHLFLDHLSTNKAFVAYRMPNQTGVTFLQSHSISPEQITINDISSEMQGFLMMPFDAQIKGCFFNTKSARRKTALFEYNWGRSNQLIQQKDYLKLIAKTVASIKFSDLEKVVLSRNIQLPSIANEKIELVFSLLVAKYPNAFVYLLQLPNGDKWMGATPETLLSVKKGSAYTMALAGTQLINKRVAMDIGWEQKEMDEQAFVASFIKDKLVKLGYDDIKATVPYTRFAGHLAHICTDFNFTTKSSLAELIATLHPTPAVCGSPSNLAFDYIQKNESYNREFYTGFIGPINKGTLSLFVNLRSLKIDEKRTYIYIGGGITSDSIPELEWLETERKSETLISVINAII